MATGLVARRMFLTKGVGRHKEKLTSFEMSLRDAGIAEFNLVRVSSIFPPGCKIVGRENGRSYLTPGEVVHVVMSESSSNEPHRLLAASVGVAIPKEKEMYGYLSEHHSYGETDTVAGDYAEDLAATMLATILGVPFDPNKSWNEKKEQWRISDQIVLTRNIVQSAIGAKDGQWTTVVTAAVLIP